MEEKALMWDGIIVIKGLARLERWFNGWSIRFVCRMVVFNSQHSMVPLSIKPGVTFEPNLFPRKESCTDP